ncbi:hypothetical protein RUND412_004837 [Rhizina undulata]
MERCLAQPLSRTTRPQLPPLSASHTIIEISDDESDDSDESVIFVGEKHRCSNHPLSAEKAAINESFSVPVLKDIFSPRKRILHVKIPASLAGGVLVEMRIVFEDDYPMSRPAVVEYVGCNARLIEMGNSIFEEIWQLGHICLLDFFITLVTKIKEGQLGARSAAGGERHIEIVAKPGLPQQVGGQQHIENVSQPGLPQQTWRIENVSQPGLTQQNTIALERLNLGDSRKKLKVVLPTKFKAVDLFAARDRQDNLRAAIQQADNPLNWILHIDWRGMELTVEDIISICALNDYPPPIPVLKQTKHQRLARVHITYNHQNNNERLEFLGDRICAKMMAEMLIKKCRMDPYGMHMVHEKCVSNLQFAIFYSMYGLHSTILQARKLLNVKDRGDAWEAMVGGLYLDCEMNTNDEKRVYDWWVELLTPWVYCYLSKFDPGLLRKVHGYPRYSTMLSAKPLPQNVNLPSGSRLLGEASTSSQPAANMSRQRAPASIPATSRLSQRVNRAANIGRKPPSCARRCKNAVPPDNIPIDSGDSVGAAFHCSSPSGPFPLRLGWGRDRDLEIVARLVAFVVVMEAAAGVKRLLLEKGEVKMEETGFDGVLDIDVVIVGKKCGDGAWNDRG